MPVAANPSLRQWWLLYAVAVASFVPTFGYYLVGEEGILVNSSLEMWQRGDWLRLWFYGGDARHGVFANWLIIPLASALDWEYAPGVVRAGERERTMFRRQGRIGRGRREHRAAFEQRNVGRAVRGVVRDLEKERLGTAVLDEAHGA